MHTSKNHRDRGKGKRENRGGRRAALFAAVDDVLEVASASLERASSAMAALSQAEPFDPDKCPCALKVVPAPFSRTMRGTACRYTGGHCEPCDLCPQRVVAFGQEQD